MLFCFSNDFLTSIFSPAFLSPFYVQKIKPVPIHKTLILVNNFLVNTAEFFNNFSNSVEKKISDISKKITEVEVLLAVLEAKLGSVAELSTETSAPPAEAPPADAPPAEATPVEAPSEPRIPPPPPQEQEIALIDENLVKVSEHPSYMPYLRLLKAGVPFPVVLAKATGEGLNAEYLENPDTLIPRPV